MTYSSRNFRAAANPLRSVPLYKSISAVFGDAWFQDVAPAHIQRERTLTLLRYHLLCAQHEAEEADGAYRAVKAELGDMNRRRRKDRHDRALVSDRLLTRQRSEVFSVMNRRRARLCHAVKALAAAETNLAAEPDAKRPVVSLGCSH